MLKPGDTIDIWVVEAALGSGGMGSVYRCHNRTATRILAAVKVLEGGLNRYPQAEARFIREAEILFQLEHPNIVKVRNVRTDTEPPYLEMEFVAGESLEERLRRGSIPYEQAVPLLQQCADAVAYLHSKGIRHRDIKPANLLVMRDGRLKLVDFGLAVEADTTRITQQGMTFGTVAYAPPEWIAPDTLDPEKWDAYAMGVVFHEILTGKVAFPTTSAGTARQQAVQMILAKQGHAPLDPGPAFHDDVRALIGDLTRSDPKQRLSDPSEVLRRTRALVPTLRGSAGVTLMPSPADDVPPEDTTGGPTIETPAPAPPLVQPVHRPVARTTPLPSIAPRRRPWLLAGLGAALALGAGALLLTAAAAVGLGVWFAEPAARAVRLAVVDLPAGVPVEVELAGLPARIEDGGYAVWDAVPVGVHPVSWTVGKGCTLDVCPGTGCPPWCGVADGRLEVLSGDGRFDGELPVEVPAPRPVALALPAVTGLDVVATLARAAGRRTPEGVAFDAIPPGEHVLEVTVGACPPEARGCWPDGACPTGCTAALVDVVVPVAGEAVPARPLDVPAPAAAPAPAQPAPAAPRPAGGGRLVTVGELADWLATHPDHAPGSALTSKSGSAYLKGWTASGPPAGVARTKAVTGASGLLAAEFCRGRGGVPSPDAEPRLPTGVVFEIRFVGPEAKLVGTKADGSQEISPLAAAQAATGAGFRCVR